MVFKGVLTKESGGHKRCVNVAIKTIKSEWMLTLQNVRLAWSIFLSVDYTAYQELRGFLLESSLMCSFDHPNVLGMEGICFDVSSQSPYLILPFMTNGDLKSYLKNKRTLTTKSREDMFPLVSFTLQDRCINVGLSANTLTSTLQKVHFDISNICA